MQACIESKEWLYSMLFPETMVDFRKIIHKAVKVERPNFYHLQLSHGELFLWTESEYFQDDISDLKCCKWKKGDNFKRYIYIYILNI